MNVCQRTRKLIDESHRSDVLPIEASGHIEACAECQRFAGERAALRSLLGSGERIMVPASFEAQLNRRLADLKKRPAHIWLSPAVYMRLAAAAAMLIVAAVVVPRYLRVTPQPVAVGAQQPTPPTLAFGSGPKAATQTASPAGLTGVSSRTPVRRTVRYQPRNVASKDVYVGTTEGGVILLRVNGGDFEMPVRTVSLGAQPLLYGPDGRQQIQLVKSSF